MDTSRPPQTTGDTYCAWLGFWLQFALLGALALLGLYVGSSGEPGDYTTGLILAAGSVLLAFMRLKDWFDGGSGDWMSFLFVDRMANLVIVVPLFTILALAGLFIAAGEAGSLQDAGVGLFAASGLVIFLSLKRVFDQLDLHR